MRLFSAIGLVIFIVALKILMTDVFSGFEDTLLMFFEFSQAVLGNAQTALTLHAW